MEVADVRVIPADRTVKLRVIRRFGFLIPRAEGITLWLLNQKKLLVLPPGHQGKKIHKV